MNKITQTFVRVSITLRFQLRSTYQMITYIFLRKRLRRLLSSVTRTSKGRHLSCPYEQRPRLWDSLRPRSWMSVNAKVLRWWRMWQTLHITAQCHYVYSTEDDSRVAGHQRKGGKRICASVWSRRIIYFKAVFQKWISLLVRLAQFFNVNTEHLKSIRLSNLTSAFLSYCFITTKNDFQVRGLWRQ